MGFFFFPIRLSLLLSLPFTSAITLNMFIYEMSAFAPNFF